MAEHLQESLRKTLDIIDKNSTLNENQVLDEGVAEMISKLKSYIGSIKSLPVTMKKISPLVAPYTEKAKEIIKAAASGEISTDDAKTKFKDLAKSIATSIEPQPTSDQVNEALDPMMYYALNTYYGTAMKDETPFFDQVLDMLFNLSPDAANAVCVVVLVAIVAGIHLLVKKSFAAVRASKARNASAQTQPAKTGQPSQSIGLNTVLHLYAIQKLHGEDTSTTANALRQYIKFGGDRAAVNSYFNKIYSELQSDTKRTEQIKNAIFPIADNIIAKFTAEFKPNHEEF